MCLYLNLSLPASGVVMAEPTSTRVSSGGLGAGGVLVPQEPSLKAGVVVSDERVDFLREQAFCVLRVKTDKWNRFIGADENQRTILDFLDHIWSSRLLLFTGPGGTLHAGDAQVGTRQRHLISFRCHFPIWDEGNIILALRKSLTGPFIALFSACIMWERC